MLYRNLALLLFEETKEYDTEKVALVLECLASSENIMVNRNNVNNILNIIMDNIYDVLNIYTDSQKVNMYNVFTLVLSKINKLEDIKSVCNEYRNIYYKSLNIERITVYTVIDIEEYQKKTIKSILEKRVNKKISIEYKIDKRLIGGIKIAYDNNVLDISIKRIMSELT